MAAFVVYDLTRLCDTLPSVTKWRDRINSFVCSKSGDPIPTFLLGNMVQLLKIHMCGYQTCMHFPYSVIFLDPIMMMPPLLLKLMDLQGTSGRLLK